MDDENEQGTVKSQPLEKTTTWEDEFEEGHQSQVEKLEEKLMEVKAEMKCTEDDSKETAYLQRRVKTTATMVIYLKSKVRIMAVTHLACVSCGIKHQEGLGLVDKNSRPFAEWSDSILLLLKVQKGSNTWKVILISDLLMQTMEHILMKYLR
ncbi:unnamed protein product [Musa textilis]